MKRFAILVAALAMVAGVAGGFRAYSAAAPAHAASAQAPAHPKPQPVKPGPTFRWAPCTKPAVRVGRACVTHVTRTVTLPAPVVTAAPVRVVAPAPRHPRRTASPSPAPHSDDGGGHHGDDGGHDDGGGHDD